MAADMLRLPNWLWMKKAQMGIQPASDVMMMPVLLV
jgi:hypothetical protein